MNQIKKAKDLIGKTIEKVVIPEESYETLLIKFTDGSFVSIENNDVTEGYGYTKHIVEIEESDSTPLYRLVELGCMSIEEKDEIDRKEKEQSNIWEKERLEKNKRIQDEIDRAAYEKLKQKFSK